MDKNCDCYTIRELFDGTFVHDESCKKKIARINRILRHFFTDLVDTQWGTVAECFSGTGEIRVKTKYPIWRIHGFYGRGKGDCFQEIDWNCYRCDNLKQLIMIEQPYYLDYQTYRMECNDEMVMRLKCSVVDGYFVYARGPKKITSLDDEVCLEPQIVIGLQSLIEQFYTVFTDEHNKSQLIENRYNQWLEKAREMKDYIPYAITRAYLPQV